MPANWVYLQCPCSEGHVDEMFPLTVMLQFMLHTSVKLYTFLDLESGSKKATLQCAAKKVSPKVICHFLRNHLEFLCEILRLLPVHIHIKNAKQHLIAFNYCKVTKFFV